MAKNYFDQFDDQSAAPQGATTEPTAASTGTSSKANYFDQFDSVDLSQAAPQTTEQPEDKESLGYALQHPIESFSSLGQALVDPQTWEDTGRRVALATLGTRDKADWEHPLGYLSPYQSLDDVSKTDVQKAQTMQTYGREGLKLAAYVAAADATGGLAVPILEGAGLSPALAALGGSLTSNAAGSVASQSLDGEVSLSQTAQDMVLGEAFRLGGQGTKAVAKRLYNEVRPLTIEERAAKVADQGYLNEVLQGGNTEAQKAYRTANTDAQGNSILNPSQTFTTSTPEGRRAIAAEQRDINRGTDSSYYQNTQAMKTGEGFQRAIDDAASADTLHGVSNEAVDAFKAEKNQRYQEGKDATQSLLDSFRVKTIKMPETNKLIDSHLNNDSILGGEYLQSSTKSMMKGFKKAQFRDVDDLDFWKRKLNEKQRELFNNGHFQDANAIKELSQSLQGETETFLQRLDPQAANTWKDADVFFKQSVGDFGDKSVLGKIASRENPDLAGKTIFTGENATFNAQELSRAMQDAINRGDIAGIQDIATRLSESGGTYARNQAMSKATTSGEFSPVKMRNELEKTKGSVNALSGLGNASDAELHQALQDAASRAIDKNRAKVDGGRFTSALASGAGNAGAKTVGAIAGAFHAGPAGAMIGAEVASRISKAVNNGLFDRIAGVHKNSKEIINYLSDPVNAAKVDEILRIYGRSTIEKETPKNIAKLVEILNKGNSTKTAITSSAISSQRSKKK